MTAARIEELKDAVGVDRLRPEVLLDYMTVAELNELTIMLRRYFPEPITENTRDWYRSLALLRRADERRLSGSEPFAVLSRVSE